MATRAKIPATFEQVHAILGASMRASAPSDWPSTPHLGGPIPQLGGWQQVGVALWCADQIADMVPADDAREFAAALAVVRADHDGRRLRRTVSDVAAELRDRRPRPLWFEVVRNAAAAARSHNTGGSQAAEVNKYTRAAAAATVELLGGGPAKPCSAVREFLVELDDRLCFADLQDLFGDESATRPLPDRLLFRPPGSGKRPALLLGRRRDGLWLYLKLKSWKLILGSDEEVLACIPEAHFAGAMASVRGAVGSTE